MYMSIHCQWVFYSTFQPVFVINILLSKDTFNKMKYVDYCKFLAKYDLTFLPRLFIPVRSMFHLISIANCYLQ